MKKVNREMSHKINVSLVAFYGDKPGELVDFIEKLQDYLLNHQLLRDQYVPYQLEQVHGTIIGCEGFRSHEGIISQWFQERRQEIRYINFSGLIDYLQHQVDLPMTIRFGGYDRQGDYKFLSRGQHLYHRSFQLQLADNQTIPIIIGWSWQDSAVTLAIDKLRRSFQQFNLLHKYHGTPEAVDNDFYLRLGTINGQLTSDEVNAIATEIQSILETQPALHMPITLDNLAFVQYQDLLLTPATTKIIPFAEITSHLS